MRISDWSSDVCSSDLRIDAGCDGFVGIRIDHDDGGCHGDFSRRCPACGGASLCQATMKVCGMVLAHLSGTLNAMLWIEWFSAAKAMAVDRQSTRLNSSYQCASRMPSSD